MSELSLHESFQIGEYIEEKDIKKVLNYIAGNLISWSPNRSYWYTQYKCATKLSIMFVGGEKREVFSLLPKKEKIFVMTN